MKGTNGAQTLVDQVTTERWERRDWAKIETVQGHSLAGWKWGWDTFVLWGAHAQDPSRMCITECSEPGERRGTVIGDSRRQERPATTMHDGHLVSVGEPVK